MTWRVSMAAQILNAAAAQGKTNLDANSLPIAFEDVQFLQSHANDINPLTQTW